MKPSRDMESVVPKARPYTWATAAAEVKAVMAAAEEVKAVIATEEVKAVMAVVAEVKTVMATAVVVTAAEEAEVVRAEEMARADMSDPIKAHWAALEKSLGLWPWLARFSLKKHLPGWPRFWELFGFCLPKKTREKVYDEIRNELLEDYYYTRKKYHTKGARRWLTLCFTFRTVLVIGDCWRVLLGDGVKKALLGFLFWRIK